MRLISQAIRLSAELALASLHLLYPPRCAVCERELERTASDSDFTCPMCRAAIERLEAPWCDQCGDPVESAEIDLCERCAHELISFELCRSYGFYDGPLARLIQLLKFERERALAHDLAPLLQFAIEEEKGLKHFDAITFVPMRAKRQHERGFNQAELLAKALGQSIEKPVISTLKKIRETCSQMELTGDARRENLSGAFAARSIQLPESLLLVDDVYTTGSTLSECAKALKASGVERITAVTLARAPLSDHTEERS